MRKILLMLTLIIGFIFIPIVVIYAASEIGQALFNHESIEMYFYSLAALSSAVIPVTQLLKKLINSYGNWTRFLSWFVAVGLAFVGWWLGFGMMEGITVTWVFAYGIAAGLISNSVFDAIYIEMILKLFKNKTQGRI